MLSLSARLKSGCKRYHSSETALPIITNEILQHFTWKWQWKGHSFITTCEWRRRPGSRFVVVPHVFVWSISIRFLCWSYISSRAVTCGVPEGFVLGSLLLCIDMRPLELLLQKHDIKFHFSADDTQLNLFFVPCESSIAVNKLDSCLADHRSWVSEYILKLNADKPSFL